MMTKCIEEGIVKSFMMVSSAYTPTQWSRLERHFSDPESDIQICVKESKLSRRTQSISTWCLQFPAHRLDEVVTRLQQFEDEQPDS